MNPIKYANDHPWIYVVLAFLLLIAVGTTFIILAVKNRPDPIPLSQSTFQIPHPVIQ